MQEVIQQLRILIREYAQRFNDLSGEEISYKPSPAKWSKNEILGHLIDSAQSNIQRFVRSQYETLPHIAYNQDIWVAVRNYQNYSAASLIQLWKLLNEHICIILQNMPAEIYSHLCDTGKETQQLNTVEFLAADYLNHHIHHLEQIF